MKTSKKKIIDSILIFSVIIGLIRAIDSRENIKTIDNCVEDACIEKSLSEKPKTSIWFNYVHDRFSVYNRDIDSNTITHFINVADHYGFIKDSTQFSLVVGQILLESGANQYYFNGHPLEGRLVLSPVGAVGITQIMPTTAHYFISKILTNDDIKTFKKFGATDFSFARNENLSKEKQIGLTREWLSNSKNNIIMWGYIMRYNMSHTNNNIIKSLIAYNAGRGGLNIFMKNGNSIWSHDYIKGIYNRLSKVKKKIS